MEFVLKDVESQAPVLIRADRRMTDDEYYDFCQANPDLRIERSAEGEILIMAPTGGETSDRNIDLSAQLHTWARRDGRGKVFDSNVEFVLPSSAARSPDASWVERSRWDLLTREQKRKFPPLCPDFVVELTSPSDRLDQVQAKMREWMENGVQLGWLLDADHRTAYIYRPNRKPEKLLDPRRLVGEGPVGGFVLELAYIWSPD
ncbi:MAG: Uma2 family endonuclease [Acidobacteria bacterium]|nr:Uma2 family endonuclease [Acidobacteriota bacterium]